jgi:hypothetical protein
MKINPIVTTGALCAVVILVSSIPTAVALYALRGAEHEKALLQVENDNLRDDAALYRSTTEIQAIYIENNCVDKFKLAPPLKGKFIQIKKGVKHHASNGETKTVRP